ncbi:hypothetical protein L6452_41007 [Arctium lappa]|uniref:Uncharacterized protein n=1 Tax=Arctium lappa TaxID=4217 RepID=A0ACB8XNG8_ARCLA|nr:hypothetical protein L6452_41007 [Arctium lappa]
MAKNSSINGSKTAQVGRWSRRSMESMRGEEGTRAPAATPPTNDPMDATVEPSIEPTPEEPQVSIPSPVSPPPEGLVTPITGGRRWVDERKNFGIDGSEMRRYLMEACMKCSQQLTPIYWNQNRSLLGFSQSIKNIESGFGLAFCLFKSKNLASVTRQCRGIKCENGHIACSTCCSKVKRKCPSCCMPIGYNRCRAIEKVIESIRVSCKNSRYGCKETMPYSKKSDHEQTCPHATCFCPHPSCPFASSSKNLYLHFGIQHAASTTRFTYNTTFTLRVETHQKHVFLQEQHESVIFILNHEVLERARSFNVDCVGTSSLKTAFTYQLSAKSMETTVSLQSVPEIYAKWSEHNPRKNYLTVPSEFSGSGGILSLDVCIKKAPSPI